MTSPPSSSKSTGLTLAILIFILVFFLVVSCVILLFLGVTPIDGSWRSLLALVGASAILTTAVVAGAVGALAMWFQLRIRTPEPPAAPRHPEPSKAFQEDAETPPSRRRRKKPSPTDETLDL